MTVAYTHISSEGLLEFVNLAAVSTDYLHRSSYFNHYEWVDSESFIFGTERVDYVYVSNNAFLCDYVLVRVSYSTRCGFRAP